MDARATLQSIQDSHSADSTGLTELYREASFGQRTSTSALSYIQRLN